MSRLLLALALLGLVGCDDAVSGRADAMPDAMDAIPDAIVDAMSDAMADADAPDAMRDAMPDAMPDAIIDPPDAMPDAMPGPTPTTPLDAPLPDEPSPIALPADAALLDALGRPCRGDLYVVDAAPERPPPVGDIAPVAAALRARARRDFAAWFCEAGAPCGGADRVTVGAEALLPVEEAGGDAARFHRLWFEVDGNRLTARDTAQCDIITALRAAVAAHGAVDDAYIGRACEAVAQSPAAPTEAMRRWHLDRLGLPDAAPAGGPAHIALIDTAPDPAVAEAIDAIVHPTPGFEPALHGTAMATLARQAAPGAQIHVFPALTPDHTGPVGAVARAISRALVTLPAGEPRVINLSLGWPPELNQRTPLIGEILDGQAGRQCETTEDPTAAPVRWALGRAADAGVTVIAAGGNRTDEVWLDARIVGRAEGRDRCAADWQAELRAQPAALFYPAQWGLERSCVDDLPVGRRLTVPVAAHDARDQAAGLTTPFTYATLLAPGQHVVVDGPAPRRRRSVCVDADTPPPAEPAGLRLPATLSGTSVAAALTSGLVARWLGALGGRGDIDPAAIGPRRIELALMAAAIPLCPGPQLYPDREFRRVAWPGLETLAACDTLPAVLDCFAAEDDDLPLAVSSTLAACAAELAGCGLDPEPEAPDCAADPPAPPDWADAECSPLRPEDPAAPDLSRPCEFGVCPFTALAPDRYSVGGLGPQPQDPWCPDCRFAVRRVEIGGATRAELDIALNPAAPPETRILSPILAVRTLDGQQVYVGLADYVPTTFWKPGAGFTIADIKLTLPGDPVVWGKLSARLVLYVQQPDGKTVVRDVSPLRVIVR